MPDGLYLNVLEQQYTRYIDTGSSLEQYLVEKYGPDIDFRVTHETDRWSFYAPIELDKRALRRIAKKVTQREEDASAGMRDMIMGVKGKTDVRKRDVGEEDVEELNLEEEQPRSDVTAELVLSAQEEENSGESITEGNELKERLATPREWSSREERLMGPLIGSSGAEVRARSTNDSIIELPEKKGFRVSWICRCNRKFESIIPGTDHQVAEAYLRKMDWDVRRDGPMIRHHLSEWMENVIWAAAPSLLGRFSFEIQGKPIDSPDLEGGSSNRDLTLQRTASPFLEQRAITELNTSSSDQAVQPDETSDPLYVCFYKPKDHAWRLGHIKFTLQTSPATAKISTANTEGRAGTSTENPPENMDKRLFTALKSKLLRRKRLWTSHQDETHHQVLGGRAMSQLWCCWWNLRNISKKLWDRSCGCLSPVAISSLELWEFYLTPAQKLVDPVRKGKLPQEENKSRQASGETSYMRVFSDEWEYSALTGEELAEFKSLIGGHYMFHLLKHPEDANPSSPIWTGLPKKIGSKLVNNGASQKTGWGFQVEYEWNTASFVIITSPFIVLVFIFAIILCAKFKWSVAAGVTLSLAPVTIFGYINVMIGGVTKQNGLSK